MDFWAQNLTSKRNEGNVCVPLNPQQFSGRQNGFTESFCSVFVLNWRRNVSRSLSFAVCTKCQT